MNGGTRRRGAAERLVGKRFTDVQNGVVQEAAGVNAGRRFGGIHRDGTAVGGRILRRILRGGGDGVITILETCQRRSRHRHAPLTVGTGGAGIGHAIEHHADDGARRKVGRGTGNGQILTTFLTVDNVIARDSVYRQLWLRARLGRKRHRVLDKRLVARGVSHRYANRLLAVCHLRQRRGRHGHAPGAVRLDITCVRLPVEGDSDGLARFHSRGGTGDLQRRLRLCGVDKVICRDGIDRHQRRVHWRGIQRQRDFLA
ncbi:hypothetical protein BN131_1463 [Cronobacter malonaticus 681]|nr:hypothetical protein BN131_1463 [Cronobacter malonaticus 681]